MGASIFKDRDMSLFVTPCNIGNTHEHQSQRLLSYIGTSGNGVPALTQRGVQVGQDVRHAGSFAVRLLFIVGGVSESRCAVAVVVSSIWPETSRSGD